MLDAILFLDKEEHTHADSRKCENTENYPQTDICTLFDVEGVLGSVAASVGYDHLILAYLGKLVAYRVLDLLAVKEHLNLCFLGNVGKSDNIGSCSVVLNAIQNKRGSGLNVIDLL